MLSGVWGNWSDDPGRWWFRSRTSSLFVCCFENSLKLLKPCWALLPGWCFKIKVESKCGLCRKLGQRRRSGDLSFNVCTCCVTKYVKLKGPLTSFFTAFSCTSLNYNWCGSNRYYLYTLKPKCFLMFKPQRDTLIRHKMAANISSNENKTHSWTKRALCADTMNKITTRPTTWCPQWHSQQTELQHTTSLIFNRFLHQNDWKCHQSCCLKWLNSLWLNNRKSAHLPRKSPEPKQEVAEVQQVHFHK